MCGIAGAWGAPRAATVRQMLDRIAHRGPDASGLVDLRDWGTLGHRRLAIIDPEGGNQPIASEDRSKTIVSNGELYNHRQLRDGLAPRHGFRTGSDGESALHLFEERGVAMVRKLDGMFALALADGPRLLLARDPLGIKPLYYAVDDDGNDGGPTLLFASEIKALADSAAPVRELPPGTCYDFDRGLLPYYRVPEHVPRERPEPTLRHILRATLEEAVTKRLMSDVPVGVFLSGGLDSSIVAALAARHLRPLRTFAVGTPGSSDLAAARRVARHIGAEHHEYLLDPDEIARDLPRILHHLESFDQDLVRSAIPCFYCARLAAEHVKVVLTGEGADELFAGYGYYRAIEDPEALHAELRRSVTALHNVNLQRLDRMTMAHGLEGRVPFLDLDIVRLAQTIAPEFKLRRAADGTTVDKWILRAVAEELLPRDIVWRDKQQFDEGSGVLGLVEMALRRHAGGGGIGAEGAGASPALRSAEEATYWALLAGAFGPGIEHVIANVGRWNAGRLAG